jgi:hypothetical protein
MKKIKILGIIALALIIGLSMVGCKKGGTVEIENKTDGVIWANVINSADYTDYYSKLVKAINSGKYSDVYTKIKKGATASFEFEEDGQVWFSWKGEKGGGDSGYKDIADGEVITITAK